MRTIPLHRTIPVLLLIILFSACQKRQDKSPASPLPAEIQSARIFFANTVLSSALPPATANYRARLNKTIRWDLAQTTLLSGQTTVIAPVQFTGPIYITSDLSPSTAFDLGSLTRLVISRDSNNVFHYGLLTYIPDSNAITTQSFNSGIILYEDWQGHSLSAPCRFVRRAVTLDNADNKQVDVIQTIQVCNTIDGYNYAPDDPAGGTTTWSETSCNTYNLPATTTGPTLGPGSLPGILGPKPIPLTIQVSPPTSPIGSITDYLKCFSNYGGSDHTYTVTVCVDQPVPGSRTPWTFTSVGTSSTTAVGNPFNTGHTFLVLAETFSDHSVVRNVGFYPQTIVTPLTPGAQGQLNDDEGHDYNISLTISVDNGQFFNILNYVGLGNNPGLMYNLNNDNCTTFDLSALAAAGINLPSTKSSWLGDGYGNDPGDLGEDIRNMSLAPNMVRNTVSNPHPNQSSCN